jgi:hypothetical protein
MTHQEKINWMANYAVKNKVVLDLEGEVGFGRECVGITMGGTYPDYVWYDDEYERIDNNGNVWTPKNAYHKHECVAVLGRGEEAEAQLYEWLKWFDNNGFVVERTANVNAKNLYPFELLMGKHEHFRMVRKGCNDGK